MNLNRLFSIMLESTKRASLRKKLTKFCLTTAIITTFTATAVSAQNSFAEIEPLEFSSEDLGFPPNIEYEDLGKPKKTKYWQAGERIENILQLKDFDETGLPSVSLSEILTNSYTPIDNLSLADFSLLKKTKLKKLVNAVPSLKSFRLNEVEPLYDLVKKGVGSGKAKSLANTKISSVIKDNKIANLSLNKINLNNYSLDSIPQLINSPLNAFPHWGNQFLSEIPGLVEMPFKSLFNFLSAGIPVAKVDLILNSAEGYIDNTITGSYQSGFNVNCDQADCEHIELIDYLPAFSVVVVPILSVLFPFLASPKKTPFFSVFDLKINQIITILKGQSYVRIFRFILSKSSFRNSVPIKSFSSSLRKIRFTLWQTNNIARLLSSGYSNVF